MARSQKISRFLKNLGAGSGCFLALGVFATPLAAQALVLDWSGQFWAENLGFSNYSLGGSNNLTPDAAKSAAGGYYIPGGGNSTASWQSLFLRLRPKAIVNDNISIKSELWAGTPTFGMFGDSASSLNEGRFYNSTLSRGAVFSAQRFWAEVMTDVGTVQVGRLPLNWGLGIVWNSGDALWSRYMSTGDALRMVSKFGAFTFIPSFIKYSQGNTVGGACNFDSGTCGTLLGIGSVVDYSFILKYENPDDDLEGGVNFIRRLVGASQDTSAGFTGLGSTIAGGSANTFSIYARKKFKRFSAGAEVPVTAGDVGGLSYKSFAVATEAGWSPSENLSFSVKAGIAPGQPNDNGSRGAANAFFFHPNYKLGLVMFGTQLAALSGVSTQNDPAVAASNLRSPFDNPIVNANYVNVGGSYSTDRWTFGTHLTFASARETAKNTATSFYNTVSRRFETFSGAAPANQDAFLGWEMDYGVALKWDDHFTFQLDLGWFFPGGFYKFSNTANENAISSVFASAIRMGVNF